VIFSFAGAALSCNALLISCFLFSNRLPGGGITFFAAAKKVIKESSFFNHAHSMFSVMGFGCSVGPVESALTIPIGPGSHAIRAFSPTPVTAPFGLLRPASRPVVVSFGNRQ
jgi:hypothetical protein